MLVPAPGKHNYFLAVARPIAAIKMPKKKERDAIMRTFGVVRGVPLDISMCIRGKINRNRYVNHYGRFFLCTPRLCAFDERNENNIARHFSFRSYS